MRTALLVAAYESGSAVTVGVAGGPALKPWNFTIGGKPTPEFVTKSTSPPSANPRASTYARADGSLSELASDCICATSAELLTI